MRAAQPRRARSTGSAAPTGGYAACSPRPSRCSCAAIAGGAVALTERGTRAGPGDRGDRATPRRPGARGAAPRPVAAACARGRQPRRLARDPQQPARRAAAQARRRSPSHRGSERLLDDALSPDGRYLAVRGDDGSVAFFDATRCAELDRHSTDSAGWPVRRGCRTLSTRSRSAATARRSPRAAAATTPRPRALRQPRHMRLWGRTQSTRTRQ